MELVYLWVEEYKNIKNQGFNFSPRFTCKYDKGKNELAVEKKDYVHILPDNINITVVVGANGSGKSTLIQLIIGGLFQNNENWRKIKNLLLVFEENDKEKIFTFSGEEKDHNYVSFSINNQEVQNLYTDYTKKCKPHEFFKKNFHLLMDFSLGQQQIWNDYTDYKKYYALEPSRIYKSTGGAGIISKIEPTSFDSVMKVNVIYFYHFIYKNNLQNLLDIFKLPTFEKIQYISASAKGKKIKSETFKELKDNNFEIFGIKFKDIAKWENVTDNIYKYFENDIDIISLKIDDLSKLEMLLIFSNIEMVSNDLYFWNLSTGQQLLISYMGIIVRTHLKLIEKSKKQTFSIFIDEIETSLHPNWQKKSLFFIIKFLEHTKINTSFSNINFIINTHSPFILSDIPSQNIIFLDKDEKGNCKNVSKEVNIETFGANIHTLLSHGFFMKDGLMGEFAKNKINEVIDYLNGKNSPIKDDDEAQRYIHIIGEPIVKRQLQRMLDSKKLDKMKEIDTLKNQIESLKNRLDILVQND